MIPTPCGKSARQSRKITSPQPVWQAQRAQPSKAGRGGESVRGASDAILPKDVVGAAGQRNQHAHASTDRLLLACGAKHGARGGRRHGGCPGGSFAGQTSGPSAFAACLDNVFGARTLLQQTPLQQILRVSVPPFLRVWRRRPPHILLTPLPTGGRKCAFAGCGKVGVLQWREVLQ